MFHESADASLIRSGASLSEMGPNRRDARAGVRPRALLQRIILVLWVVHCFGHVPDDVVKVWRCRCTEAPRAT